MKRLIFQAVCAALFLFSAACGKGLNGTYVKCIQVNTASSQQTTYVIPDSKTFTYQSQTYTTSDCEGTPNPQPTSGGKYTESSSTVSGAKSVDFAFDSGTLSGTTLFQIYKIDGNNLFLGDTANGKSGTVAELRPTALEATPYFRQ